MGHINYGREMPTDIKGMFNFSCEQQETFVWKMYKVPINNEILKWNNYKRVGFPQPTLLKSEFSI